MANHVKPGTLIDAADFDAFGWYALGFQLFNRRALVSYILDVNRGVIVLGIEGL